MLKKTIFILSALVMGISFSSDAQIINNYLKKKQREAEKKVEKKVEEKADEKVDKEIDKAVDKLFKGLFEEEKKEPVKDSAKPQSQSSASDDVPSSEESINNAMSGLLKSMGVGAEVPHEDAYKFSSLIKMKIDATDEIGNKQPEAYYNTFFNENNPDYAIEFTNDENEMAYFIFDSKNSVSLIMGQSEDNKTGIATTINEETMADMMGEAYEDAADQAQLNLMKTGKTKSISGYKCQEYKYEDDENVTYLYATKALKGKLNKVYKSSIFTGLIAMPGYVEGVVVQYDSKSKLDKSTSVLTIVDVDMSKKTVISTEGYQFIGFSVPTGEE